VGLAGVSTGSTGPLAYISLTQAMYPIAGIIGNTSQILDLWPSRNSLDDRLGSPAQSKACQISFRPSRDRQAGHLPALRTKLPDLISLTASSTESQNLPRLVSTGGEPLPSAGLGMESRGELWAEIEAERYCVIDGVLSWGANLGRVD